MSADENKFDEIDALLAKQPIQPSADFSDRVLDAIHKAPTSGPISDEEMDSEIDRLLASQVLESDPDFTETTIARIKQEAEMETAADDPKIIGMPRWVFTIGSMAAAVAFGMFAFIKLFQVGIDDLNQKMAENSPPAPITEPATVPSTTPKAVESNVLMMAESVTPTSHPEPKSAPSSDLDEFEDILLLEKALSEILPIENSQAWETLALLAE